MNDTKIHTGRYEHIKGARQVTGIIFNPFYFYVFLIGPCHLEILIESSKKLLSHAVIMIYMVPFDFFERIKNLFALASGGVVGWCHPSYSLNDTL